MAESTPRFVLEPLLQNNICEAVKTHGVPITVALKRYGISRQVWHLWRKRAEKEETDGDPGVYSRFVNAIFSAEGEYRYEVVKTIKSIRDKGGEDNKLKAAIFEAKARMPREYGPGSASTSVSVETKTLTPGREEGPRKLSAEEVKFLQEDILGVRIDVTHSVSNGDDSDGGSSDDDTESREG